MTARVLLVDNDTPHVERLEDCLASWCDEVMVAGDEASAMAKLVDSVPDLVIIDARFAEGVEVAHRARESDRFIPILALAEASQMDGALADVADDVVASPYDETTLTTRARALLRMKQTADARSSNADPRNHEYMGFVAHDLKNPISAAIGNVGFARENLDEKQEEIGEALTDVSEALRRVQNIVDDLLAVARMEAGVLPLQRERIRLDDLVDTVIATCARDAQLKSVVLRAGPKRNAQVRGDRALLTRMLENLVFNLIRHTPTTGTVELATLTAVGPTIEIAALSTGAAVPLPLRARIFDKFAQSDDELRRVADVGLGLYFSKCAAALLGGSIGVRDAAGWAAAYVVRLPGERRP